MNVKAVAALFVILFTVTIGSAALMGVVFWVSLAGFASVCLYITKNEKRLISELDDWLGGDSDFV